MQHFDYIATSEKGYIQQIVTGWVRNGYYYYVQGEVPEGKDATRLDAKLLNQYPIKMTAGRRFSRKKRGLHNLAYLRFERHWIMLATCGGHQEGEGYLDWFRTEGSNVRNCKRGQPIRAYGYSISYVPGGFVLNRAKENQAGPPERDCKQRVRVQISREELQELKANLVGNARNRSEEWFAKQFWNVPYEPYAPVRKQLLGLLRQVNAARSAVGLSKLSPSIIRYRRKPVKVFK